MAAHGSVLDARTLYFGDNGAVNCGDHCGLTAQLTGVDLYGTKMEALTREVLSAEDIALFTCETCGAVL